MVIAVNDAINQQQGTKAQCCEQCRQRVVHDSLEFSIPSGSKWMKPTPRKSPPAKALPNEKKRRLDSWRAAKRGITPPIMAMAKMATAASNLNVRSDNIGSLKMKVKNKKASEYAQLRCYSDSLALQYNLFFEWKPTVFSSLILWQIPQALLPIAPPLRKLISCLIENHLVDRIVTRSVKFLL